MPAPSSEELQRVFKTLSDITRMRILRLLAQEELMVQELMEVLGMAQSRVSRHLAILREAGLVSDRRDGTYVFYRFAAPSDDLWQHGWHLVEKGLASDPTTERDTTLLRRVIAARSAQPRNFFDAVGPDWDALRTVFNDTALRAGAISRLVPPGLKVADIGTGTGILACELARLGVDVIGIDQSARMLEAARSKVHSEEFPPGGRVELRRGEAEAIPMENNEVDAAFAHMVLHYIAAPGDVIREMTRIIRPGGLLVAVDFVDHDLDWMTQELGVVWRGFASETVEGWLRDAGLVEIHVEQSESLGRERDLPATLIASARVPADQAG
ncbi:MAG: metalloregulator ArsR/SmtB family transcription factor [Myxococcota bacterium]|jgi:ubiquinone/menaquinone biosynthesis C-methylase UbiE/DNA-binding transcriptional ArsR family regulator|nr:metalloregulator ArsR/SmtB family transcription factor [Myxococcota bacterium]